MTAETEDARHDLDGDGERRRPRAEAQGRERLQLLPDRFGDKHALILSYPSRHEQPLAQAQAL